MTDKKLEGHYVDELNIPEGARNTLKSRNDSDLEKLLGSMLHMPNVYRAYFKDIGLDYDDVKKQIYGILPKETIKSIEDYEKNPSRYSFGAFSPEKK